jgi:hypothetical protein
MQCKINDMLFEHGFSHGMNSHNSEFEIVSKQNNFRILVGATTSNSHHSEVRLTLDAS